MAFEGNQKLCFECEILRYKVCTGNDNSHVGSTSVLGAVGELNRY